jgi:hypothetical protein
MGCNNVLFGLVKSGQDCGPRTEVKSITNSISETTNNLVNSSISNSSDSISVSQNQAVNIKFCPANIDISQRSVNNIKMKTTIDDNFVTTVATQIENSIASKMQQDSKNVTDLLNSSPGGHTSTEVLTNLKRVLTNNSTNSAIKNATKSFAAAQNQAINIECYPGATFPENLPTNPSTGKIVISQELLTTMLTDTALKTAMSQVAKDQYFVRLDNDLKQSSSSQSKGLTDIVDTIGNTIKSVVSSASFIYIAIVAAIVLFIPLIIFAFKSGKKGITVSTPSGYTASTSEGAVAQYLRSIRRGGKRY